ncbi:TPA: hypothetical protein DDW35_06550 [Candidatus Sumerlaeota bacterium]|nr:hypothetical protein [Candidatus Sumerlaeota bacterium]
MVISAKQNGSYGGNLINQKYSPLENIGFNANPDTDCQPIFNARKNILQGSNYFPTTLNLYSRPALQTNHAGQPAPIIVASNNRAEWMTKILRNAELWGMGMTKDYLNPNTFKQDGKNVVIPWYTPHRSKRPLYVVVHYSEYSHYYQLLKGSLPSSTDVTVVGYKFGGSSTENMVGFGASRFAALALAMKLGYGQAWTVDDNVIQINGFPATLDTVEGHMTPGIFGIGFGGASDNTTETAFPGKVNFVNQDPGANFSASQPGLLQQVVLWNISALSTAQINMSPIFFASGEDVSFGTFLQNTSRDQRIITQMSVIKIVPENDTNNQGFTYVFCKQRKTLRNLFSGLTQNITIKLSTENSLSLDAYINQCQWPGGSDLTVIKSQAAEQIMVKALALGGHAPNGIFNPFTSIVDNTQLLAAAALAE